MGLAAFVIAGAAGCVQPRGQRPKLRNGMRRSRWSPPVVAANQAAAAETNSVAATTKAAMAAAVRACSAAASAWS